MSHRKHRAGWLVAQHLQTETIWCKSTTWNLFNSLRVFITYLVVWITCQKWCFSIAASNYQRVSQACWVSIVWISYQLVSESYRSLTGRDLPPKCQCLIHLTPSVYVIHICTYANIAYVYMCTWHDIAWNHLESHSTTFCWFTHAKTYVYNIDVYIYMYIYLCICISIYICMYIYIYMYIYIHAQTLHYQHLHIYIQFTNIVHITNFVHILWGILVANEK